MNLEDFKSFCRALKPSEVGSIPTHSRHLPGSRSGAVRATCVALLSLTLLAGATGAAGATDIADSTAASEAQAGSGAEGEVPGPATVPGAVPRAVSYSGIEGPSAFQRAARSVAIPAWGQLTNGKKKKATVLFGVQTYLYTRIIVATRMGREGNLRVSALERDGASAVDLEFARAAAQEHFDDRRNLFFWAILTGFYGALDAYVDAHLGEFEKELEEGRALFARVGGPDEAIEMGLKF